MQNKLTSCGLIAQKHDPDRFFLSLLAKPEPQPALWALIAFHFEIARTREMVTDTTMGLIRLQWWKDALKKFYKDGVVTKHEVMSELCAVIVKYNLPHDLFEALIIAREFDIEDRVPSSEAGLLAYLDYTQTPFLQLMNKICGTDEDEQVLQSIAQAYGLIGVLRAFVFHARARRCYLPDAHFVNLENVYALSNPDEIKNSSQILCGRVNDILKNVKLRSSMFRGYKALTALYLKQIEQLDYDIMSPRLLVPPAFKQLRVLLGSL